MRRPRRRFDSRFVEAEKSMHESSVALVDPPERSAPPNMVLIPGGTFRMGSDRHYPEEAPVHRVTVGGEHTDEHFAQCFALGLGTQGVHVRLEPIDAEPFEKVGGLGQRILDRSHAGDQPAV